MAKIKLNPILQEASGSLGKDLMLRRLPDGRTILCQKPDFSQRTFSQKQLSHQERFRQASAYAKQAAKTQPIYTELAAGTIKTAYNLALSDWFHPPQILDMDWHNFNGNAGNSLRVQVRDNIIVAQVVFSILSSEQQPLETGNAIQGNDLWWEYTLSRSIQGTFSLLIEAVDLAGNRCQHTYKSGV